MTARRGFARQMQRSPTMTRFTLEVPEGDGFDGWPGDRIRAELHDRLAPQAGRRSSRASSSSANPRSPRTRLQPDAARPRVLRGRRSSPDYPCGREGHENRDRLNSQPARDGRLAGVGVPAMLRAIARRKTFLHTDVGRLDLHWQRLLVPGTEGAGH